MEQKDEALKEVLEDLKKNFEFDPRNDAFQCSAEFATPPKVFAKPKISKIVYAIKIIQLITHESRY